MFRLKAQAGEQTRFGVAFLSVFARVYHFYASFSLRIFPVIFYLMFRVDPDTLVANRLALVFLVSSFY